MWSSTSLLQLLYSCLKVNTESSPIYTVAEKLISWGLVSVFRSGTKKFEIISVKKSFFCTYIAPMAVILAFFHIPPTEVLSKMLL